MQRTYDKDNSMWGILTSVGLHALLLLIAWFVYIGSPTPQQKIDEIGMAINYGFSEVGTGSDQPNVPTAPGPQTITTYDRPAEGSNQIQNTSTTPTTGGGAPETPTQSAFDAPVITSTPNPSTNTNGNATGTGATQAPQRSADPRISFPGRGNRPGNTGNEGTGGGIGDQGDPNGDPNSQNRTGNGGRGSGGLGFSLANRNLTRKPSLNDNSGESGQVNVKIYVNRKGEVERAEVTNINTTITNPQVRQRCVDAAKQQARFNVDDDAPLVQTGTITFRFTAQ